MRDSCEMRREAWGILKGKWFWRLLCVVILLQFVSSAVNKALVETYAALSITTLGDYLMATANAMRQGLSYSLPTAKAYYWMVGGFGFQLFIIYIFAAIFAFGFMGLLLKASRNDDTRWFAGSFGGFARPLEITWLLVLMNLLTALPVFVCGVVAGVVVPVLIRVLGLIGIVLGVAVAVVVVGAGIICALAIVYGYRQAWFIKNEHIEASAVDCMRASRQMMRGFKWRAFCLDCSFIGWFVLVALLLMGAAVCMQVAAYVGGAAVGVVSLLFELVAFWMLLRVFLGVAVARVVFYRDLVAAKGVA